jgi:hypothetical protein
MCSFDGCYQINAEHLRGKRSLAVCAVQTDRLARLPPYIDGGDDLGGGLQYRGMQGGAIDRRIGESDIIESGVMILMITLEVPVIYRAL